jgi:hypothetical protein
LLMTNPPCPALRTEQQMEESLLAKGRKTEPGSNGKQTAKYLPANQQLPERKSDMIAINVCARYRYIRISELHSGAGNFWESRQNPFLLTTR